MYITPPAVLKEVEVELLSTRFPIKSPTIALILISVAFSFVVSELKVLQITPPLLVAILPIKSPFINPILFFELGDAEPAELFPAL